MCIYITTTTIIIFPFSGIFSLNQKSLHITKKPKKKKIVIKPPTSSNKNENIRAIFETWKTKTKRHLLALKIHLTKRCNQKFLNESMHNPARERNKSLKRSKKSSFPAIKSGQSNQTRTITNQQDLSKIYI